VNLLEFGARIRLARERLGLSQEDLASRIQRDQRAVSEYEHGKRRIAATDLPRLAAALEVPVLYFFEGDLDSDDLDRMLLIEFKRLPSAAIKRDAIELLRVFSGAIARIEGT
jgi:transcriptional regulator with XRE-family HTH domain